MSPGAPARFVSPKLGYLAKRFYLRALPARQRRALLARNVRGQARWCETLGSSLYASLLEDAAADIEAAGACWDLLGGRNPAALGADDALPLQFMGAVHRLVLEGRAAELASYYPSVGGDPNRSGVSDVFRTAVAANLEALRSIVDQPVQTNEVGRAAALAPGLLLVARSTGLPLRLLELGASAGLNLRWDQYRYEAGDLSWGPPTSAVHFRDVYVEGVPPLKGPGEVAERIGCDKHPLDPGSQHDRLTLLSYVWADQVERVERLRGALEIATRVPAMVDTADAVDWAESKLATTVPRVATVVFHSLVIQYLSAAGRARLSRVIEAAGRRASAHAPLAWLRLELGTDDVDLRLTTWPGRADRLLATANNHGGEVRWLVD